MNKSRDERLLQPKERILICDPIDEEGINRLTEAGFIIDLKPAIESDELTKIVSNYDVLIVRSRTKVTKEIIDAGKRIKVIGRAGAGLDNIDMEAAQRMEIKILNTPEASSEAVAELTMGLMLSLARKIPHSDHSMKEGKWVKKEYVGRELRGRALGTIGLGHIGERVARLGKAFGMKILVTKRAPPDSALLEELQAEFVSLSDVLRRCDILTVHIPYTLESHHLIGENELALMKNDALLINTSRGAIIDEKSLLRALQSGKLGGAALDVYEAEPPTDWTLMQLPNVVCTPHIGAQTEEAQKMASVLLSEKIISALS